MEDTIQQLLEKLMNEWAPGALELGVRMTYWTGVQYLGLGAFFAIMFVASLPIGNKVRKMWVVARRKHDDTETYEIIMFGCFIFGLVGLIFACINLLDIWNWIAVFDPRLAFAHDIYTKLIK